jgi:hypothetical protein
MFSYADDTFYELHPSQDAESGRVNLNVPRGEAISPSPATSL